MALDAVARGLSGPTPAHPSVSGVVVDIPGDGGFATVVALTDDSCSMYTTGGGGIIGAGEHERVAAAVHALLSVAEAHRDLFVDPDDGELPEAGLARFHLLAPDGRQRVDVPEDAFWGKQSHALMPVIAATQGLISEMRSASPA